MNIAFHWQDDDSSSSNSITAIFPDCKILLCGGHAARNHEKSLKDHKLHRMFNESEIKTHQKNHPAVLDVKCCCPLRHHSGCGSAALGVQSDLVKSLSTLYQSLHRHLATCWHNRIHGHAQLFIQHFCGLYQ